MLRIVLCVLVLFGFVSLATADDAAALKALTQSVNELPSKVASKAAGQVQLMDAPKVASKANGQVQLMTAPRVASRAAGQVQLMNAPRVATRADGRTQLMAAPACGNCK